jgi:hypothetical protein
LTDLFFKEVIMAKRLIESVTGTSQIQKEGKYLCTTTYFIHIYQDFIPSRSLTNPDGEIPGLKSLEGEIIIDVKERHQPEVMNIIQSGTVLKLELEKPLFGENKEIAFFCSHGIDFMAGRYAIAHAAE